MNGGRAGPQSDLLSQSCQIRLSEKSRGGCLGFKHWPVRGRQLGVSRGPREASLSGWCAAQPSAGSLTRALQPGTSNVSNKWENKAHIYEIR